MSESRFNDQAAAKAYQELLLPLIFEPWGRLLLVSAQRIAEETLVVDLPRGLPQALEYAQGSSAAAAIRAMTPEQRVHFERLVAENLKPWTHGSVIQAPARALVAIGLRA